MVIPKVIRDRAGLREGTSIEVELTEAGVVIRPTPMAVQIEARGNVHVLVPEEPVAGIGAEDVRRVTETLRDRPLRDG